LKKVVVSHYSAAFTGGCQGKEYLKKLGLPGDRIFLGYDAIDNNYFGSVADAVKPRDGDERAVLGLPLRYFLSVGRLIPKKGFLWMLEAYAQYVNSSEGQFIPLLIVGDGPDLIGLKSAVSRLGVDSLVQFRGYKTSAEIARYMALADLLIVPSVREEQWGLVINEAMAAGVPVLGTSICGATPELVIEGTTGFAVAPLDSRKLISLLKWATMHPDRLKEMGTAARRHVEKCSLDSFSDSFYKAALCAMERVNSD
jgi:glycosyltransferase involved in cell wall biosynthesis